MAIVQKAIAISNEKKTKSAPAHPPYLVMIQEAIVSLKERNGSSQYAIGKYIEEKHKSYHLPQNFKKLLLVQLKKLVANEKLVKVKNSFKLAPALKKSTTHVSKKPEAVVSVVAKPKTKATNKEVKPKAPAAVVKPKVTSGKKVAKTSAVSSLEKKSVAKVVTKVVAKKAKSIKSPVKKAAARKPRK